jgi:hypothetical protein
MAREQKVKSNAPQASGKGNNQAPQTKSKQPEAVVAPQQQTGTIAPAAPVWPAWPTSKPGPHSTSPLPGMHPFNSFRPEQVSAVGYNQTTGEPVSYSSLPDEAASDHKSDGQSALGKRKKRL